VWARRPGRTTPAWSPGSPIENVAKEPARILALAQRDQQFGRIPLTRSHRTVHVAAPCFRTKEPRTIVVVAVGGKVEKDAQLVLMFYSSFRDLTLEFSWHGNCCNVWGVLPRSNQQVTRFGPMVAEKVRRRAGFQSGRSIRMGDRQHWMFPPPPASGLDPEYDGLLRIHGESEDGDDERRIELAMAILLLSRNYDPTPDEYVAIFSFGMDESAQSTAQAAISELVRCDLDNHRLNRLPAPQNSSPLFHTHFLKFQNSVRSYAGRVCSTLTPWLQ
jgi:hypothetical protein